MVQCLTVSSLCTCRRESETSLEVGYHVFPVLDERTMKEIKEHVFLGLTPKSLFFVAECIRKAYQQDPWQELNGISLTEDVIVENLRHNFPHAYISSNLAIYLVRFWPLPRLCDMDDVSPQEVWKEEWTEPLTFSSGEQAELRSVSLDSNISGTKDLGVFEPVRKDERGTYDYGYYKFSINNVSAAVLSLFFPSATTYDENIEEIPKEKQLSHLYPRFAVGPNSVNCRRIGDSGRIQNDHEQHPGIDWGMMETICGIVNRPFATEKYYLFPYATRQLRQEELSSRSTKGMRIVPTHDCNHMKYNNVTFDGKTTMYAVPCTRMVDENFEAFFGKSYDDVFSMNVGVCSRNQEFGIKMGTILMLFQEMLNGLSEEKDWIRLHHHCAHHLAESGLPAPGVRRVLFGQTMVMFAAKWFGTNIAALDGNNRLTSTILAFRGIYPQRQALEVKFPHPFPHEPQLSVLGDLAGVDLVLPAEQEQMFQEQVFKDCEEFSKNIQDGKFIANESSVKEFAVSYFSDIVQKTEGEQHNEFRLAELITFPKGARRPANFVKGKENEAQSVTKLIKLVDGLKNKQFSTVPPKLEEELRLVNLDGEVYTFENKKITELFPFKTLADKPPHQKLPLLHTLVVLCCYTPFWDSGHDDGAHVLNTILTFVRGNGFMGQAKAENEIEYETELKTGPNVYQPKVSPW